MKTALATVAVLLYLLVATGRVSEGAGGQVQRSPGDSPGGVAQGQPAAPRALIDQYCLGCHNDKVRSGGLALSELDLEAVDQHGEIAEKVVRKLRGGLMPPAGVRRPDRESVQRLVSWLENEIDTKAVASHPGRVPLRRLN